MFFVKKVIKVSQVCEVVCKVCEEVRSGKKWKKLEVILSGKLMFVGLRNLVKNELYFVEGDLVGGLVK